MRKKIGELLVESGAITTDDVRNALGNQKNVGRGQRLGQVLIGMGKVTPRHIARALSQQFDLPFIELPQIPASISSLIPIDFQAEHRVVPFRMETEGKVERLLIAVADPVNLDLVDELRFQLGKPLKIFVAASDDIDDLVAALKGDTEGEIAPLELDDEVEEMVIDRGNLPPPAGGERSSASTPSASAGASAVALPSEWDIFGDLPSGPPTKIGPAPTPAPTPESVDVSTADLEELLGGVTVVGTALDEEDGATNVSTKPPPPAAAALASTKPATVVKFSAPTKTPSTEIPAVRPPAPPPEASAGDMEFSEDIDIAVQVAPMVAQAAMATGSPSPGVAAAAAVASAAAMTPASTGISSTVLTSAVGGSAPTQMRTVSSPAIPASAPVSPPPPATKPTNGTHASGSAAPARTAASAASTTAPAATSASSGAVIASPSSRPASENDTARTAHRNGSAASAGSPQSVPATASGTANANGVASSAEALRPPEISEEDLKILESLERIAGGEEPLEESAKVKPAQMVASLIRLLMKKGVIGEAEFLEELGRK